MVTRLTLLLIIFLSQGCVSPSQTSYASVTIVGELYELELSLDLHSRVTGMMHREEIPQHGGMLFVFPDAIERSFWMKNCFVNIDLIFLDSRGTVTATYSMLIEPPQDDNESEWEYESRLKHYWSNGPAMFAIELAEGSIQRLGLRVNDQIALDLSYLRSRAR